MAARDNAPAGAYKRFALSGIVDFGTVVGIGAGLTGLVYVVGGAVLALRLWRYSLPTEAVVIQMPQWNLLTLGVTEVVLPTVYIVGLFALWRLVTRRDVSNNPLVPGEERQKDILTAQVVLEPFIMAWAAYVLFIITSGSTFTGGEARSGNPFQLTSKPSLPVFMAVLWACLVVPAVASMVAGKYVKSLHHPTEVIKMIGVVAASTLIVTSVLAMTLPLLDVKVCRKGQRPVIGWLIASSADRLYIGQNTPNPREPRYIESVPLSEATDVFISGNAKTTQCAA